VLLAQDREEKNWDSAQEAYNQVQRAIVHGNQLELYSDVERLLPDNIKPECMEMVMEVQAYDNSASHTKNPRKKCKRIDDSDPTCHGAVVEYILHQCSRRWRCFGLAFRVLNGL
jgi:hypothetical protein